MISLDEMKILIVDDNPHNLKVLATIIEECGYEWILADSGKAALESVVADTPDLILLDVMMPEMDGYEVCQRIKADTQLSDIPIIFLTAKTDMSDIIKGFNVGGVDYITKPFNADELRARIKTHLELKKSKDRLNQSNTDLQIANEKLNEANEIIQANNMKLEELLNKMELASITDPLTHLYNRRYMTKVIEEEIIRVKRFKKQFSILMMDIDFFKKVNDTYGHQCGDYVLKRVSEIFQSALREQDAQGRWGGEEFLTFLPETDHIGAEILAERIRVAIDNEAFMYENQQIHITITIGIAEYTPQETIDTLIRKADDALYEGKHLGRNRTVFLP